MPWNFPLLMAVWKVGPALATGCTIVLKPAEQTPLTALRLGELALEAGLPPGVLNVLTGDGSTGAALVAHPGVDKVAFTGSSAVGREIAERCGRDLKRVTLELGGKSPNIILPDADLDAAVHNAFSAVYFNSGQVCTAATRLLVQREQFDDVVQALVDKARDTVPGPGLDPKTFVGPLVSAEQLERVSGYIETGRQEAELLVGGGTSADTGWFVEPTVFTTDDDRATIVREEIFGPVLVAQSYDSHRGGREAGERQRVRPCRRRLDPGHLQGPPAGRAARGGLDLRQHLGRRRPRLALRRQEAVRAGPGARARGTGRLSRDEVRLRRALRPCRAASSSRTTRSTRRRCSETGCTSEISPSR